MFDRSKDGVIYGAAERDQKGATAASLRRVGLVVAGSSFVGLGILGIFLPVLPTTPFLLLAAACYARSSRRSYNWLLNNRWFGGYLRGYLEGRGLPLRVKVVSILLLWATIGYSASFVVDSIAVRIVLALVAVGVTIHILSTRTSKR